MHTRRFSSHAVDMIAPMTDLRTFLYGKNGLFSISSVIVSKKIKLGNPFGQLNSNFNIEEYLREYGCT